MILNSFWNILLQTDTHYAVLSFLLEMSNCPTSQSYQPSDDKPQAVAQGKGRFKHLSANIDDFMFD